MDHIGFRFQIIYKDEHLLKVRISAWNGSFGGAADIYADADQLKEAASDLQRFPRDLSDVREITFGEFGPKSAGGAISMRFYCADRAGHAYVDSRIESEYDPAGKAQSVTMILTIEPAAVDAFVQELGWLGADRADQACLKGVLKGTQSAARG
jgi:hypothetical protein